MNVLVTGGAGFIGSHLVDRLLRDGHRVVVLDNEATGRRENVPQAAHFVRGDVARLEDLEPAFALRPDAVFHVAGQVSLIRSFTDPAVDLRTNVQGTLNVLQECLKYRVPRLLYASSMQAYGATDVVPTPEDAPCRPASYYGITKYAAERYVHTTAERTDLGLAFRVTSLRMYNVYGPRQALDNPYQGVLGIFLGNLLRGEPLTIYGDGEQSRDFVYVGDVAEAWLKALDNPASHGGVFNLGSGRETSINRLADLALAALGRSRRDHSVRHAPGRPGELRRVAADITRARAVLEWEPRTSFADGLAETVRWAVREAGASLPRPSAGGRPVAVGGRQGGAK
jgi:UDP-glucose 4-epimerase